MFGIEHLISVICYNILKKIISIIAKISNKTISIQEECVDKYFPIKKAREAKDIYFKIDEPTNIEYEFVIIINPYTTIYYGVEFAVYRLTPPKTLDKYNKRIEINKDDPNIKWINQNDKNNYLFITLLESKKNYGLLCINIKTKKSLINCINLITRWYFNSKRLLRAVSLSKRGF